MVKTEKFLTLLEKIKVSIKEDMFVGDALTYSTLQLEYSIGYHLAAKLIEELITIRFLTRDSKDSYRSTLVQIGSGARPRLIGKVAETVCTFKTLSVVLPLEMIWEPKEDITTYELALCLPYFHGALRTPDQVDQTLPHFRHFKIINHN